MSKALKGVRESIQLLSSILTECDLPKIPSETFRQAKFNNEVAIEPFWSLLLHSVQLLQLLDAGGEYLKHNPQDPGVFAKQQSFHLQAFVVRKYLFTLGYCCRDFFCTPAEAIGSRELLLGFAWLLCKSGLVNKLTRYHLEAANEVKLPLKTGRTFLLDQIEVDTKLVEKELETLFKEIDDASTSQSILQNLQKLVWIRGRVLKSWEMALNINLSYQKMADRLHRCTVRHHTTHEKRSSHLNVHEIFLLRYPEQMTVYLTKLEHHISALHKLIEWKEHEPIFWQWLGSVLDLQQSEKNQESLQKSDDDKDSLTRETFENRHRLSSQVEQMERELKALIAKNQPHIDKINRLWQLKQRQCQIHTQEIESVHSKVQAGLRPFTAATTNLKSAKSSRIVEKLTPLDIGVCIQEPAIETSHRKPSAFPSLAHEQQIAHTKLLQTSRSVLTMAEKELAEMTEKVQTLQSDILEQLQVLQKRLPESVCKIERTHK